MVARHRCQHARRRGRGGIVQRGDGTGERFAVTRCRRSRHPARRRSAAHSASISPPHSASVTSSDRALQPQAGLAPARGDALLVARRSRRAPAACRAGCRASRQCSRKMSSKRIVPRGDADRAEGIEVHQAHLDVLDAALAQRVQRPLAGRMHALGPDRAVELVLDLQQAGGELAVVVAVADADLLVGRIGLGERVVERRAVALQAVVAHRERAPARRSGSPAAPCAARWRAAGRTCPSPRRCELVLAALDEARAHRGRGAEQVERAATNGAGSCGSARSTLRWQATPAARSCSGCRRSSACAGRSGATGRCGRRSSRGRRWRCRSGRSGWRRPPAGRRACSRTRASRRRSRGRRSGGSR